VDRSSENTVLKYSSDRPESEQDAEYIQRKKQLDYLLKLREIYKVKYGPEQREIPIDDDDVLRAGGTFVSLSLQESVVQYEEIDDDITDSGRSKKSKNTNRSISNLSNQDMDKMFRKLLQE